MAGASLQSVLHHLRGLAAAPGADAAPDAELLERFLARHDEAAFAALLRRHGPMVLNVCRRVLSDPHDAEDAFQATFLVFVRRAASIGRRELLGNWLYGVAFHTARAARSAAGRRRAKEAKAVPRPQPPDDRDWHDLQPLLDEELSRLPDRYRVPVVLCDLEGRGRQEVARQLGVPAGTLSSRLARARALLAGRLARRGVTVTGAALAVALTRQAASAALPPSLIVATLKAGTLVLAGQAVTAGTVPAHVAALTEGALRAMFLTRLKTATAVLFVGTTLALGLGQFAAGRLDAQFFTPARPRNNAPSTPDTPGAWEAEIKYPLKYLKASGAILSLTRALGDKQGAPVRVSADDRTNTLFLQGPADEVADLLKFVRRLDEAAKERVSAVDELVPPDRTAPAAEEPLPARVKRLERELQQWQERVKKLEKEVAGLRAERLQEKTDDAAKKALDEYLQPPPRKK